MDIVTERRRAREGKGWRSGTGMQIQKDRCQVMEGEGFGEGGMQCCVFYVSV